MPAKRAVPCICQPFRETFGSDDVFIAAGQADGFLETAAVSGLVFVRLDTDRADRVLGEGVAGDF